jgi:hypothetical protein
MHELTYDEDSQILSFRLNANAIVGLEAVRLGADLDTFEEAILRYIQDNGHKALAVASLCMNSLMPTDVFEQAGDLLALLAEGFYAPEAREAGHERAEVAYEMAVENLRIQHGYGE